MPNCCTLALYAHSSLTLSPLPLKVVKASHFTGSRTVGSICWQPCIIRFFFLNVPSCKNVWKFVHVHVHAFFSSHFQRRLLRPVSSDIRRGRFSRRCLPLCFCFFHNCHRHRGNNDGYRCRKVRPSGGVDTVVNVFHVVLLSKVLILIGYRPITMMTLFIKLVYIFDLAYSE